MTWGLGIQRDFWFWFRVTVFLEASAPTGNQCRYSCAVGRDRDVRLPMEVWHFLMGKLVRLAKVAALHKTPNNPNRFLVVFVGGGGGGGKAGCFFSSLFSCSFL